VKYEFILSLFLIWTLCANAQSDAIVSDSTVTQNDKEIPQNIKDLLNIINQTKKNSTSKDATLEIDGLLVNNTKTKNGSDFYEFFYRDWVAPVNAHNYSIFITEKPYRLTTTQIEIHINETLVFQSFLQPRSDIVEALAKQAVAQTTMYLINYDEIVKQLGGEDRSGSGIF